MRAIYTFIFLVFLLISCRNNTPVNTNVDSEKETELNEDDLGPLFSHYTVSPRTQQEKDENVIIEYLAEQNIAAQRVGKGIYLIIETPGEGDAIRMSDRAITHYEGAFLDGKVFDSSYRKNKPLTMRVNQGVVGWQIALQNLHVGGKCIAYIPSSLGYGKRGYPPVIPKNANLKFTIELLGIEKR